MNNLVILLLSALFLLCPLYVVAQNQNPYAEDIKQAQLDYSKGRADAAIIKLITTARRAERQNDKRNAVHILLLLGEILIREGQQQRFGEVIEHARRLAVGTDLEASAHAQYNYAIAENLLFQASLEQDKDKQLVQFVGSFLLISQIEASLPQMPSLDRAGWQSRVLTFQIIFCLNVFDNVLAELKPKSAAELSPVLQSILLAVIHDIPITELFTKTQKFTQSISPQDLVSLDQQRPWGQAFLKKALKLNKEAVALDQKFTTQERTTGADVAALQLAVDKSQQGDIYERLGDIKLAIDAKEEALKTLDSLNEFLETSVVLGNLTDLYEEQNTQESTAKALNRSARLIALIEGNSLQMVGQTLVGFLGKYGLAYNRHLSLLMNRYDSLRATSDPQATQALEELVLHADRTSFRPVRRDMAVYRELGPQLNADSELKMIFEQQKRIVSDIRIERDQAIAAGKGIDDASLVPKKQELVTALEDLKRQQKAKHIASVPLLSSTAEVRKGMKVSDGVVLYFREPKRDKFFAAIITSETPIRLIALPQAEGQQFNTLIARIRDSIPLELQNTDKDLTEVAKAIWWPLGTLPENLTIVLSPELMGLPFESLRISDGELVISRHQIKYALGLPTGEIATSQIVNYRKTLVFGAEKFHKPGLPSLEAGKEISLLRYWLPRWGHELEPVDPLPQAGGPLLAGNKTLDLIHISTHSYLDTGLAGKYSVPMVDALEFPQDEIFAYDLALSSVRAKLMVLSACELFRARQDDYTPVSGITTASMARISPQVISTLWRVNAEATRVFMLRFYDALAKEKDPSAALATTKRAFTHPNQLSNWLKERKIQIPANVRSYNKPYYWAPFVLTVRTT